MEGKVDDTKLWKDLPATQWFAQGNVSIFQDSPLISYSLYDYVQLTLYELRPHSFSAWLSWHGIDAMLHGHHLCVPLISLWQEVL